jgi:hypothetical protein
MKTVILHYHLFKNAGTSLDAAFKENFSEEAGEWVTKEFPNNLSDNREQLKQWIIDNPQAKCFSSHTAVFPIPKIDGVKIIPVIFIRHPIDRMASAYAFERKQGESGFGPTLARNTSLAGYIETRLSIPADRQCRDFHAHRLATMFGEKQGNEVERAIMAIEKLPFVGVVELFSDSLEQLQILLRKNGFKSIKLKPVEKNISRNVGTPITDKVTQLTNDIGESLYKILCNENATDIKIWESIYSRTKRINNKYHHRIG